MFEVAEHASRAQPVIHLRVERALAFVRDVMDREAGDDRVERAPRLGQWLIEIVRDDADGGVGDEPLAQPFEHRLGKVGRDRLHVRLRQLDERQQAPVAAPQVEHPCHRVGQTGEQFAFPLRPMRNRVGARQIRQRVRRR